jgi:hypothetical protein
MMYLSFGLDLASTFNLVRTIFMFSMFPITSFSGSLPIVKILSFVSLFISEPTNSLNSGPSMQTHYSLGSSSSAKIPHSLAIAMAVVKLSPVTILTLTPASLHYPTASGTSYLMISLIPAMAQSVRPPSSIL